MKDKGMGLTFREFVFFEIDFISKRVEDEECIHCFNEIRKKIKEFFDYADCADKGEINSEMLFKAVFFYSLVRQPAEQIPRHHFHDQRLRSEGHGD